MSDPEWKAAHLWDIRSLQTPKHHYNTPAYIVFFNHIDMILNLYLCKL